MVLTIAAIVFLLLLSAFFSGSETALTASSRPLMHQLEQQGNPRARLVNHLYEKKERLIGSILLGNNLVNILASALATNALITIFGAAGVVYATLAMTLLVLIFAEVLPKTYAFRHANHVALSIAPSVNFLVIAVTPLTIMLNAIIHATLHLFGADHRGSGGLGENAEELRGAIALHGMETDEEEEIAVVRHERNMLRSVLDLAEVQVGEITIHRKDVVAIDADLSPGAILSQVLDSPYTRIPLWKNDTDNIVGVLHAKDLLRAVRAATGEAPGRQKAIDELDIMAIASKPWFVPEHTLLLDQLQAFRERREHFALVVDEYGSLLGIVTLEDILEEIVGDISDEHDVHIFGVTPQTDGAYIIRGTATIRDLNRQLDWRLPDEDAATIAGLVLHEARRIPEEGQVFQFHGFRFEILRLQRHQIVSLRVTPPNSGDAEEL
ncbi:HlyC/CorC family transporter [Varunaivibrio sulfuroxidans]|uniref:Mg2+/Co2+ transporter CorB n=1 Tax=Varunaivibrio sulfuroxidans TaxID=1773489 RepID=A0A4R3JC22_9PROT|nr:HlyC/CorC family transporter [Varunaivibrio sulfuroxidans]TCS63508.1 Mg2+/Co2+ transporter CorB [Varunaivibrio sulfuroxidans]WES30347.1 HlyC/CorC family transporter [Varunaivibrio sulfuroxidans]